MTKQYDTNSRVKYTNEINKTLNSKVYYMPESHITEINLTHNYKIKALYMAQKEKLVDVFTVGVTPLLRKKISIFLDANYNNSDDKIFELMYNLLISLDFTEEIAIKQTNLIKHSI